MNKSILRTARAIRELVYYRIFKIQTSGVRIVLLKEDSVLLIKHSCDNFWVFPGGGVKKNESPRKAASRETKEEVNYQIIDTASLIKVGNYSNNNSYKKDMVYLYVCLENNFKELKTTKNLMGKIEIEKQEWFPVTSLPRVSEATKKRLNEIKNKNQNGQLDFGPTTRTQSW